MVDEFDSQKANSTDVTRLLEKRIQEYEAIISQYKAGSSNELKLCNNTSIHLDEVNPIILFCFLSKKKWHIFTLRTFGEYIWSWIIWNPAIFNSHYNLIETKKDPNAYENSIPETPESSQDSIYPKLDNDSENGRKKSVVFDENVQVYGALVKPVPAPVVPKRGRGRPKKVIQVEEEVVENVECLEMPSASKIKPTKSSKKPKQLEAIIQLDGAAQEPQANDSALFDESSQKRVRPSRISSKPKALNLLDEPDLALEDSETARKPTKSRKSVK